ncbi:MAG: hypothetical protein K0Q79_765 [Flavipsychrobacter sp.]|jgi:O-antigen/teichoic acid export membrane protein|nr:hypothetical protein [Flavipsychrobacter sp.]
MPLPKAKSNALYSNSFFIFITRFFPSLASLLVMIWYSRHLPPATYGDYQHFWIHLLIFYPIACIGLHVLIVTYSKDTIAGLSKKIKVSYYALYVLWIGALSAVFAKLQCNAIDISCAVPFLFLFCYSLTFIFESFLIVFKNYTVLVLVNILYSAAFCLIHWLVLQQDFDLLTLFTYLLGITALRLVIYLLISLWHIGQHQQESDEDFAIGKVRSLWRHLGLYDILQVLSSYIDKFMISILLTSELSAIYYNGSQNIPFIPLLLSAAGTAVLIQLASNKKDNETGETIKLMHQSGKILSCIVFPLFFFLLFYRTELIVTVFTEKYIPATPVFLAAIFVIPVRAYSFTTILQRQHKGNIINIGAVSELLLACALMYPLYKWLGLPGVALSFVISTYLQAAFYLYHSGRLLNVSPLQLIPYKNWLLKLIIFATLFIAIHYITERQFTPQITLILGGTVMAISIVVALLIEFRKQREYGSE